MGEDVDAADLSVESFVASTEKRFGEVKAFDFLSAGFGDSDELDKCLLDGLGVRGGTGPALRVPLFIIIF